MGKIKSNNRDPKKGENLYDYYASPSNALLGLLHVEKFSKNIWEPACGEGHISKILESKGFTVRSTDIIDRGYGLGIYDFLTLGTKNFDGDIITNPPFIYAQEFIEKGLRIIPEGRKVAMLLKLLFLEGKERKEMFRRFPPNVVYCSSSRITCAKNGNFNNLETGSMAYAWFVWTKGYKGDTLIKWFN